MSFPCEGNTVTLPEIPEAERFRAALSSQLSRCRRMRPWGQPPERVLKGHLYMTRNWAGIFRITRVGTYRGIPVLSQYRSDVHGIRHNEGLLLFENKEEAIHTLKSFRRVLEDFHELDTKFLRLDKVWLEDSMLGLPFDGTPGSRSRATPKAGYILYLYAAW